MIVATVLFAVGTTTARAGTYTYDAPVLVRADTYRTETGAAASRHLAGRLEWSAVLSDEARDTSTTSVARGVATNTIADDVVIVRGGASDMPAPGQVFSGSQGSTLDQAAAGVPHGQIRATTAGEIRSGGGTVTYAPELNPNVGKINYQHVDVCMGSGSCPFGNLMPNPILKAGRFGGADYPYGMWGPR